jgi:hypothetical protein
VTSRRSDVAAAIKQTTPREPAGLVMWDSDVLELLAYLVASAELCTREPYYYGTYRLLDGASRLAGYVLQSQKPQDAWLREFKREVDEKKGWLMWDRDGYYDFLEKATGRVAEELKRRAGTEEHLDVRP